MYVAHFECTPRARSMSKRRHSVHRLSKASPTSSCSPHTCACKPAEDQLKESLDHRMEGVRTFNCWKALL